MQEGTRLASTARRINARLITYTQVLLTGSHGKHDGNSSRRVESGISLLDNNAVNLLMAFVMSAGGMVVSGYLWDLPLGTILQ